MCYFVCQCSRAHTLNTTTATPASAHCHSPSKLIPFPFHAYENLSISRLRQSYGQQDCHANTDVSYNSLSLRVYHAYPPSPQPPQCHRFRVAPVSLLAIPPSLGSPRTGSFGCHGCGSFGTSSVLVAAHPPCPCCGRGALREWGYLVLPSTVACRPLDCVI